MYWWNMSKLEDDLREGRVSENERFMYYPATFLAWNLAVCSGYSFSMEDLTSTALNLTATIIGTISCHRVNKMGDNADFIPRMICLGWPAGIRIAVFFASIALLIAGVVRLPAAAYGLEAYISAMRDHLVHIWGISWGVFFLVPYYSLIYSGFIRIAQTKAPENMAKVEPINTRRPKSDRELAWEALKYPLAVVGGIGIAVLSLIVAMNLGDLEFSERTRTLLLPGLALMSGAVWLCDVRTRTASETIASRKVHRSV
ncbi:hypothetical protein [Desulfomonile tiedjei]|uniref:Uncharacterized protein n=1 Tax=Desulfomonile tiedjei (strain ATCC 49306 / DSM 6799 / DCB-1) TaxID=706587 RepID=I4CAS8_DESTA|nr:hypothetical protein [Desulfomonile tiedjei]AFM26669.1 hypothetical protein Desti_4029 [Desulfomonile tiedjei DSM 6799]